MRVSYLGFGGVCRVEELGLNLCWGSIALLRRLLKTVSYKSSEKVVGSLGFTLASPFCENLDSTWRFMGSYKWGYKARNMGYNYTYNPTYN